jgi:uncharacterized protein (TIGR00159 family)
VLDAVTSFFRQLARSVRVADGLDVLLVAAFLYALLTAVRRGTRPGTTWRLSVVLAAFAAVYLLAGAFSMYLVERLLGVLFGVFVVAAVVLFQSEIRRVIDRIGAVSFGASTAAGGGPGSATLDTITEAARQLAKERVGALMAVRGHDSWDGVTQGGMALDGRLSLPLLKSIFHEDTDGHDGAVLIERKRATRFGVHLPLAANLPESSRAGGTRHAAALGLAEQSDAFVIVVSEERGTISVAEGGTLEELDSPGALRERLGRFWEAHYEPAEQERWWSQASARTALLSVLLASLIWLALAYDPGSSYRTFDVPVAFRNVEPAWLIEEPDTSRISIALSGSERAFQLADPAELSVSFPFSDLEAGRNHLRVTADNLNLPSGLRLEEARPQTVHVDAWPLRSIRLPVRIQTSGPVPDSLRLRATPDSTELLVRRDGENVPEALPTESVAPDSLRAAPAQVALLAPEGTRLPEGTPRNVQVRTVPVEDDG